MMMTSSVKGVPMSTRSIEIRKEFQKVESPMISVYDTSVNPMG